MSEFPGATLFDLGNLWVNLLPPGDLPKKFRDDVVSEAQPI